MKPTVDAAWPVTHPARLPLPGAWLAAALGATGLDLGFAMAFWAAEGVPPVRILQSIAGWVQGPAAFDGGLPAAGLGAGLYFALMGALALLYRQLARQFPRMLREPVRFGMAYGAAMYVLVFHVVVPLFTAAGPASHRVDWVVACLLAYMVLVGLPCAWAARRAARTE